MARSPMLPWAVLSQAQEAGDQTVSTLQGAPLGPSGRLGPGPGPGQSKQPAAELEEAAALKHPGLPGAVSGLLVVVSRAAELQASSHRPEE